MSIFLKNVYSYIIHIWITNNGDVNKKSGNCGNFSYDFMITVEIDFNNSVDSITLCLEKYSFQP